MRLGPSASSAAAAYEGAQWKVPVRPLLRRGARKSPGQDRLHAVEQFLGNQRLEIAAFSANAVIRNVAVVEVHPVPIDGPWIEGFVLDRHVILRRADRLSNATRTCALAADFDVQPQAARFADRNPAAVRVVPRGSVIAVGPVQCEWCLGNSSP